MEIATILISVWKLGSRDGALWERSSPISVARVQFRLSAMRHTWVEFVVSSRQVLQFSFLHKNQHLQIPIQPG